MCEQTKKKTTKNIRKKAMRTMLQAKWRMKSHMKGALK